METRSARGGSLRLLQPRDAPALELFAEAYPFRPYYYYDGLDQRRLTEYFYQELCTRLGRRSSYIWVIQDQIRGILFFDCLDWDSRIFDIPMSKVDLYVNGTDYSEALLIGTQLLAVIDELCVDMGVRHVASKVNTLDIPTVHALERYDFHLMDTIALFSLQPNELSTPNSEGTPDLRLRQMRDEDLLSLSTLSRSAFTNRRDITTRFNGDPLLMDKAGDLYAEWIRNSYRGDQADIVFVAEIHGRPIGFITCEMENEQAHHILGKRIGSVPLNAVDPEYRNQGVYTQLVMKAVDWFREQGADVVEIKTQIHTRGVHRTWQKLNGKMLNSYHVLHQWRDSQT
jgi:GNAT superfamily N-acetyltransferase